MLLEPPLVLRLDAGLVLNAGRVPLVPQNEVRVQLLEPDADRPAI